MVEAGNPAARAAAYDDPAVREAFPMADLIRDSIDDAGPRPITPYYGDVSSSVQRTWHPPSERQAPETPEETDSYMADVLAGDAAPVTRQAPGAPMTIDEPAPPAEADPGRRPGRPTDSGTSAGSAWRCRPRPSS